MVAASADGEPGDRQFPSAEVTRMAGRTILILSAAVLAALGAGAARRPAATRTTVVRVTAKDDSFLLSLRC